MGSEMKKFGEFKSLDLRSGNSSSLGVHNLNSKKANQTPNETKQGSKID